MNDDQNHGLDDRVHALFAELADDPAPPLGFTADGIAGLGRRGARTRRIAAVGGATAGVAALAVAVATLPGAVASGSGTTSAAASSAAPGGPSCAADLAHIFPSTTNADTAAIRKLALEVCPALGDIGAVLDPTGGHLVTVSGKMGARTENFAWNSRVTSPPVDGMAKVDGVTANLCYSSPGPASNQKQDRCSEPPGVDVRVLFDLSGTAGPASRAYWVDGGSTPWTEMFTETMKDGSKVTVDEARNGDRVSMRARRVLPSGAALTILAANDDGTAGKQGSAIPPFPFTVRQSAAAVEVDRFVQPEALNSLRVPSGKAFVLDPLTSKLSIG